jgi:3-deoxy-D-manno-octulosonic-acid transferase
LFVAGSTGPGEEPLVLDAFAALRERHPQLQLALIPRKPERFDEVAALIAARGFTCVRRTDRPDLHGQDARAAEQQRRRAAALTKREASASVPDSTKREASASVPRPQQPPAVLLGDTMGELRKFYSLATIVFVGRTLVPMGGSDVMEVAGLARPMIVGPHVENFADAVARLLEAGGAAQVVDSRQLLAKLVELFDNPDAAQAMGRAAREVVRQNVGATRRTVDLLCEALHLRPDHPATSIATARV